MNQRFKKYLSEAKKGDMDSQYKLATMYQFGNGTSMDLKEAIKWYKKASDQGHPSSLSMLKTLKEKEESFEPLNEELDRERQSKRDEQIEEEMDEEELKKHKLKMKHIDAENGDLSAQSDLATDYFLDQEPAKAYKWALLASKQGDASSQHTLGVLYKRGFSGQKANIKEAVKWLTKSADQGDELAQEELFEMYYDGDGVPKDNKKAIKWLKELAGHNSGAQHQLAVMYERGEGVTKNDKEAVKWLTKAAENGSLSSQLYLGNRYYDGEGVLKDYKEAAKWYKRAAGAEASAAAFTNFDTWAQVNLAEMYILGEGVSKDYKKATKWFRKAAEQGVPYAQYQLYKYANDFNIDTEESLDWLEKSAGIGKSHSEKVKMTLYPKPIKPPYARAQFQLGIIYYEKGGGKDRSISKYLIKKAYRNTNKVISEEAEEFWNKHELWNYKDYKYKYKNTDEPSDEQLLKENIVGATDFTLGNRFINGKSVLKDPTIAIKYFKKESKKGDRKAEASYELGVIYFEENSVQNYSESKKWIKKAYESTEIEISKKAEDYWNKHKLWKY